MPDKDVVLAKVATIQRCLKRIKEVTGLDISALNEYLFGEIVGGRCQLSRAGVMIQKWWIELTHKFTNIELDEFIIMPNHMHRIIVINYVGADQRVCPDNNGTNDAYKNGTHTGAPLHKMIQWFKTMTTKEYTPDLKCHQFNLNKNSNIVCT